MKFCPLPLMLALTLIPFSALAGDNYCQTAEVERNNWGAVEELAGAIEQAEEGDLYLVQLEDGTELVLSNLQEEESIGDEDILASASKKHKKSTKRKGKKKHRYTNRGILGPKGKWPVKKGGCTTLTGQASYYGGGEKLKKHTASGKVFNAKSISAAHRTLPLGSRVEITNPKNGRKISSVVINDRGPAIETGREIDVTKAVAKKLGFIKSGHTKLKIKVCRS